MSYSHAVPTQGSPPPLQGQPRTNRASNQLWQMVLRPAPNPRSALVRARLRPSYDVAGRIVLITGASSGIGRAAAISLADAGAQVILVARRIDELYSIQKQIAARGGTATVIACDLTARNEVDKLVAAVLARSGGVDVLINNAGRSIRRPLTKSWDRLHDFDRTMDINYFGPVQLTMGLLPAMTAAGGGHLINVGTWTLPAGSSPNFAAYHSSKAAMAAFGRCVGAELAGSGIDVSDIHFPLVHTPMSAPTERFATLPGLTPEAAAEWITLAVRTRPDRLLPRYAVAFSALNACSPRTLDKILRRLS